MIAILSFLNSSNHPLSVGTVRDFAEQVEHTQTNGGGNIVRSGHASNFRGLFVDLTRVKVHRVIPGEPDQRHVRYFR